MTAAAPRSAVEDPSWPHISETITQADLEAIPLPVDSRGLVVSELDASGARVVVVSPAHQSPTGTVMHPTRRAELIAWARRTGGLVVEDDYDAEYPYDGAPIASLQSLPPEHVDYIGTCSKIPALLERGDVDRHLRRTRHVYHARRVALVQTLATGLPRAPGAGRIVGPARDGVAAAARG